MLDTLDLHNSDQENNATPGPSRPDKGKDNHQRQ